MKKIIMYVIFLLSLFVITNSVYAEDHTIGRGQSIHLDFSDYEGMVCTPENFSYLQYNKINEFKGTVTYVADSYPSQDTYVEVLKCNYSFKYDNPSAGAGTVTYNFNIYPYTDTISFRLIKNKYGKYNLFSTYNETGNRLISDLGTIVSVEDNTTKSRAANKYISWSCAAGSTSSCVASVNSDFPEDKTAGMEANYLLKYKDGTGKDKMVYIDITIFPSAFLTAHYGGVGTCGFDSTWVKGDSPTIRRHKLEVGKSITFPNCNTDGSANPLIEFVGWIDASLEPLDDAGNPKALPSNAMTNDLCRPYVDYPANATATMNDKMSQFVACYGSTNGVVLLLNGGKFNLPGSAVIKGDTAYIKTNSSYTLPNATDIPEMYDVFDDATFVGWVDSSGNILKPGDVVTPDGSYYSAKFSNTSVGEENTYSRVVYINEPDVIVPKYGSTMKTCESADELKVEAFINGSECTLLGQKVTEDNEYVNVFVTYTDGSSEAYKVRVEQYEGQLGSGDGTIDLDKNEDYTVSAEVGNEITFNGVTTCDSYWVYSAGYTIYSVAKYNSKNLNVLEYLAESNCGDGNKHLALCMDPGRGGPNNGKYEYVIDSSFNPNNDFGKLIRHIVKKMVDMGVTKEDHSTGNNNVIAAANISLRVVQYYSLIELAADASPRYASHVAAYKALGDSLKTHCGDSLEGCAASTIDTALGKWTWNNASVRALVVEFLSSYETVAETEELSGIEGEAKVTAMEADGDAAKISIEGEITFADVNQMNNYTMTTDCPGFECSLVYNYKTGNVWKYKMEWKVNESNVQLISSLTGGEKPAVVLTDSGSGTKAANVFVLKPAASNLQRMVIFNTESTKIRVEVPINACSLYRTQFAEREDHPAIPSVIRPNSDDFNATLFQELGCCSYIPDSSETHKTYCSQYCYSSNFTLYCDPHSPMNKAETEYVDTYSLKEGFIGGIKDENKKYTCVVDVTSDAKTGIINTNKKVDFAGNKYLVKKNDYCAISCREEWDFSMPSFDSFIGTNSVTAGMYFIMNKEIFIGTKRNCYTTYIDYSDYVTKQQALADSIMEDHSTHSEFTKVYSTLKSSTSQKDITYYTYYYNSSENYWCHGDGIIAYDGCADWESYTYSCNCGEDGCGTCTGWYCAASNPCRHTCHVWRSKPHTCTIYQNSNSSQNFRSYDQGNRQNDGTGSNLITSYDAAASNAKTTNSNNIGSNTWKVTDQGSMLQSYYWVGDMPDEDDHSASDNNGICCGGGENYNCGGTVANHDYIVKNATYTSNHYGVSGVVRTVIDNEANSVANRTSQLVKNAENMSLCQNFYLKNNSDAEGYEVFHSSSEGHTNYSNVTGGKLFKEDKNIIPNNVSGYEVQTKFQPAASYKYEEIYFMNELAKDEKSNIIEVHDEYNTKKGLSEGSCVDIDRVNQAGETLQLCWSGKETNAYNPTDANPWTNDVEGPRYSDGSTPINDMSTVADTFNIPVCKTLSSGNYEYNEGSNYCNTAESPIYKVHYINKNLANSSYFRNKGHWYIDSVTDAKAHGDTKTAAVARNSNVMKQKTTNIYGAEWNTFPIALDTPKNIYQYQYAFAEIGLFPDGTAGRIMGDGVRSMVVDNTRSCFYEVIENLCTCCGDPILFYTYETTRIEETEGYLDGEGYDFDKSKTDYDSKNSILNIFNSNVSLYDPDATGEVAPNWSTSDVFVYEGEEYTTGKGAELLGAIEGKGETIYDTGTSKPEYSYTLNPNLLSQIRNYNGSHRYGYNSNSVKVIGNKICFNANAPCSSSDDDETPGYFHFASLFLEESYMVDAITPAFKNDIITKKNGSSSLCIVENAADVYNPAYSSCRWIDYKEVDTGSGGVPVRLALK